VLIIQSFSTYFYKVAFLIHSLDSVEVTAMDHIFCDENNICCKKIKETLITSFFHFVHDTQYYIRYSDYLPSLVFRVSLSYREKLTIIFLEIDNAMLPRDT